MLSIQYRPVRRHERDNLAPNIGQYGKVRGIDSQYAAPSIHDNFPCLDRLDNLLPNNATDPNHHFHSQRSVGWNSHRYSSWRHRIDNLVSSIWQCSCCHNYKRNLVPPIYHHWSLLRYRILDNFAWNIVQYPNDLFDKLNEARAFHCYLLLWRRHGNRLVDTGPREYFHSCWRDESLSVKMDVAPQYPHLGWHISSLDRDHRTGPLWKNLRPIACVRSRTCFL